MRTLDAQLTTAQQARRINPYVRATIASTDYTDRLIGYRHHIAANRARTSRIVLNNADRALNTTHPQPGDIAYLQRGITQSGLYHLAGMPRLWVETIAHFRHLVILECIDFWGRLARWRADTAQTWTGAAVATIVDWILARVGLTRAGTITALTLDFTIPKGQRADTALRRICAKIDEYPYHGLATTVNFKALLPTETPCYTFAWHAGAGDHPYKSLHVEQAAWEYNQITVTGAIRSSGATYTGTQQDAAQIAAVGTRFKHVRDPDLTTDLQCLQRARAELRYHQARATQVELTALPCHGLEIYDQLSIASTPWGASSITSRVAEIIERYGDGDYLQEIRIHDQPLIHQLPGGCTARDPLTDDVIQPGHLPDHTITADQNLVEPGALSAYPTIGAVVLNTDPTYTAFAKASELQTAYYNTVGRPPQVGDTILASDSGTYRLFILESANPLRWRYFNASGSL